MVASAETLPRSPRCVRRFQVGDELALFAVHRSAIAMIASRDYTPEQIRAWLPGDGELASWAQRMRRLAPFVACDGDEVVGYADLQADGPIDHFFVSGYHPGRGIGTLLMRRGVALPNALMRKCLPFAADEPGRLP